MRTGRADATDGLRRCTHRTRGTLCRTHGRRQSLRRVALPALPRPAPRVKRRWRAGRIEALSWRNGRHTHLTISPPSRSTRSHPRSCSSISPQNRVSALLSQRGGLWHAHSQPTDAHLSRRLTTNANGRGASPSRRNGASAAAAGGSVGAAAVRTRTHRGRCHGPACVRTQGRPQGRRRRGAGRRTLAPGPAVQLQRRRHAAAYVASLPLSHHSIQLCLSPPTRTHGTNNALPYELESSPGPAVSGAPPLTETTRWDLYVPIHGWATSASIGFWGLPLGGNPKKYPNPLAWPGPWLRLLPCVLALCGMRGCRRWQDGSLQDEPLRSGVVAFSPSATALASQPLTDWSGGARGVHDDDVQCGWTR